MWLSHYSALYEDATSLVAITNLLFNRDDPAQTERAHQCARDLLNYIHQQGLSPYRARIDMMDQIVSADDPYWQTVRQLKTVFDPDNITAPRRYNLV